MNIISNTEEKHAKERHLNLVHGDLLPAIFTTTGVLLSVVRYLLMYGSRNSAKSMTAGIHYALKLGENLPNNIVFARETAKIVRMSQIEAVKVAIEYLDAKMPGFKDDFRYRDSRDDKAIIYKPNGNTISIRSFEYPDAIKSFTNMNMAWLEEADKLSEFNYRIINKSIRSASPLCTEQLCMTFNPDNISSWTNRIFFPQDTKTYEKPDGMFDLVPSIKKDTIILHVCYKHNTKLPQKTKEAIEDEKEDESTRVDKFGLWGKPTQGLIYPNYSITEDMPFARFKSQNEKMKYFDHYGYAIDYGFNAHETVVLECGIKDRKFFIKEHLYAMRIHTTDVGTGRRNLEQILKDMQVGFDVDIFTDKQQGKDNEQLADLGYNIRPVAKGSGSVVAGVKVVKNYDMVIVAGSDHVKAELDTYSWELDKETGFYTDRIPKNQKDHAADGWRYFGVGSTGISLKRGWAGLVDNA